jgi:3-isopropylmalate/(R)-2-methylmalate dehydratase small subunit
MEKFTTVSSPAVSLPESNIDTDVIFPARFLILTIKQGLGKYLFNDHRLMPNGSENPNFALNIEPFRHAKILVAGENFGCGSSREQAVWALKDYGIQVVIATRFGEIFYSNCFKNAVLPIILDEKNIALVESMARTGAILTVDLENQHISCLNWAPVPFEIEEFRRKALLNGWDEITMILQSDADDIAAFETREKIIMPWLYDLA